MSDVKIERKELGNGLQVVLLTIDGVEGMLLPEVVRVLGIPEQTVHNYRKANGVEFPPLSGETARTLRKDNVIALTGRAPKFVPKTHVHDLVRFYSTPETDTIYKQLWSVSEAVFKGDYVQAAQIVGTSYDDLARYLNLATDAVNQLILQRDAERTAKEAALKLVHNSERNAATHAAEHGFTAHDIIKKYPEQCKKLILAFIAEHGQPDKLTNTGILTVILRNAGITSTIRVQTRKGPATLFDIETIDNFFNGLV